MSSCQACQICGAKCLLQCWKWQCKFGIPGHTPRNDISNRNATATKCNSFWRLFSPPNLFNVTPCCCKTSISIIPWWFVPQPCRQIGWPPRFVAARNKCRIVKETPWIFFIRSGVITIHPGHHNSPSTWNIHWLEDSTFLTQPMDPEKKSLNFIFPTKHVIPKSLKFSLWPSKIYWFTVDVGPHENCSCIDS